ncbi:cupin-like domain-containing protein [SAR92 clade bacterium H455]|uniref:Cupin-like domain-containing protein n=1 Tax=SAR92 clade bacterium H455 TaxID=2974818 RepID=A0ABY5TK44_9GAMM|nr:cupin-like domain-containing protein [SAR92 clade bacterium H455]
MLEIKTSVKTIDGCRADSIPDEVLHSSQPLVLRGLIADWPLVAAGQRSQTEASDYLLSFDSGKPLTAMVGDPAIKGHIFYNSDLSGFNFDYQRLHLANVLEQLVTHRDSSAPPTLYVGSTNVDNWLPGFRQHNDLELPDQSAIASVWIGNRSRISAHYDFPTNIACCAVGRRCFTLFPPNQLDNLYVGPIDLTPAGQPISLVDFSDPDYRRFPKFRQALESAQVVELEPGDAILIPSMWWHHVEALEPLNVLVNYWWRDTPSYLGGPLNVLQHGILGLRDLPPEQRQVWKQLFDHYVFNPDPEHVAHIPEQARGVLNPIDEATAKKIRTMLAQKLSR